MARSSGIKASWMRFVYVLGQVQTALLLSLIYLLILGPMALLLRGVGRGDLLGLRVKQAQSFSHRKQMIATDVERCSRQF